MRYLSRFCAAAAFAMASTMAAHATLYTYSATIDLSTGTHTPISGFDVFDVAISGAPSFALVQGDTISGTIHFANHQAITVYAGYSYAELVLLSNIANVSTSEDMTVSLLGVSGSMALPNPDHETIFSGFGAVGPIIGPLSGLTTSSLTFTGMQYSLTLTSGSTLGANTYFPLFTPNRFEVADHAFAGGVVIGPAPTPPAVPEPATLALVGAGLLMASRARRRSQPRS